MVGQQILLEEDDRILELEGNLRENLIRTPLSLGSRQWCARAVSQEFIVKLTQILKADY